MPDAETLAVARQWMQKAENDLTNAAFTLQLGKDCPTDTVCFHAEQCVEKYLKALLVANGLDFPRTHQIAQLLVLIPQNNRPLLSPEEQELFTDYAVSTRYPGDYEHIPLKEAREAVRIAKRVRREARATLTRLTGKL